MRNTAVKIVLRDIAHADFTEIHKNFENDILTIVSLSSTIPPEKIRNFKKTDFETHLLLVSSDPLQTMSLVCLAIAGLDAKYINHIEIVGIIHPGGVPNGITHPGGVPNGIIQHV